MFYLHAYFISSFNVKYNVYIYNTKVTLYVNAMLSKKYLTLKKKMYNSTNEKLNKNQKMR